MVTGHKLCGPSSIPSSASFSAQLSDRLWGPPSLLSNGYRGQEREADHSPPDSAAFKST
jgi:hypothetical protein